MHPTDHSHQATPPVSTPPRTARRARWIFAALALVSLLLLALDHRAHLAGLTNWLPYLILLACPLMHVFMHRGHGGHGAHRDDGHQ